MGRKDKAKEGGTAALADREKEFSQWYIDVVRKADLADYSDVRGCMVIKPYGFALWERMQSALDQRIKATGHENAYFPLFVPESLLRKEAEHVAGFAPEVPWVTHVGEEKLEERLCIRPTSEAIIGATYARWIQSYRDLPLLINQWCNVVRWEKRTRLFLRTSEFLWQEGHTCHRTAQEAYEETLKMLRLYHDFLREELALPSIMGKKTEKEKFAGAVETYSIEAMMADRWALQAGTSHFLGQNFAKAFGIQFLDEDNAVKPVWQTSWGVSTRLVGALIMAHGDQRGLVLPPRLAPIQIVIVPIVFEATKAQTLTACARIESELRAFGLRVKIDDRDWHSPGYKFNHWELRGVPVRLEVGPKDVEKGQAVVVRRDTGEKVPVGLGELTMHVSKSLMVVQARLLAEAEAFLARHTFEIEDYAAFREAIEAERGFVRSPWDGTAETEARIQEETKATIRCIPLEGSEPRAGQRCVRSGEPARHVVIFARAY